MKQAVPWILEQPIDVRYYICLHPPAGAVVSSAPSFLGGRGGERGVDGVSLLICPEMAMASGHWLYSSIQSLAHLIYTLPLASKIAQNDLYYRQMGQIASSLHHSFLQN